MTGTCETCGNTYNKSFKVVTSSGIEYTFDCYECAITKLAPVCVNCGCRVIGHGVTTVNGEICCCDHCAIRHESHGGARLRSSRSEDRMRDETLIESFPASDPPSTW